MHTPEDKIPPPELRLYFEAPGGVRAKEIGIKPTQPHRGDQTIIFNTVFINRSTTNAVGINIDLEFWWDGERPSQALKLSKFNTPKGWEIKYDKIHNCGAALMRFRSDSFIAYSNTP